MRIKKRGFTMIELLTAAALTTLVLGGSLSILTNGSTSWAKGMSKLNASTSAQMGVRSMSDELRLAMAATIDPDGMGVTFMYPKKDKAGQFLVPIVWDGVKRHIYYSKGKILLQTGPSLRSLCSNVLTTDPTQPGNPSYQIFTGDGSDSTRSVTMELATSANMSGRSRENSRMKTTIYLRNITNEYK